MKIDFVPVERDKLGESPVWDSRVGALYWADQLGQRVRRYTPATNAYQEWPVPQTLGCVVLTDDENVLVIALVDGFYSLDLSSGECVCIAEVSHPRAGIRLNDGRADRSGRLVSGSVVTDGGTAVGKIYRLSGDGGLEVLREEMVIPNSICFNRAGDKLYYVCSRAAVITVRDYDPDGDYVGEERPFADVTPHGGTPDGATIDSEGALWVAQIRAGQVLRFLPDGTLDRKIELPAPHSSSLSFGGPDLDTLYVTTVRETGMLIKSDHPKAGSLLAISDLGVKGLPEGRFALAATKQTKSTRRGT